MKKSVLAIMVGALCIILSSCQETPEESSVVSKVDGISEAAVCEPLKKGEKRETNVPTHWKFEEKKSNDRVVIQADIKLGEQSIGNLPVIEMQNHELTQEELNGLIDYFTDGEELYMPQMVTKDAYQEVLDRISSKEGSYLQSAYSTSIAGIQNATREGMELAPDEASAPEKMEIKFQKKTEDHGVEAARSWMSTELENTDTEDYFTADVGEDRKAYIEAERYNQEIDNDSSFLWMVTEALGGEVIRISATSDTHINALDMDRAYGDERNPIVSKSEFVLSLFEQLIGDGMVTAKEKSILGRCTEQVYLPYIRNGYKGTPPTLQDFYRLLQMQPEPEAQGLALSSELFITGTLNTFAQHTNVDTQARIIAYDIRELGEQLMPLGMLVTLDAIYNRVIQNWKKGRRTWIFCDEFYRARRSVT